ncbi:MAG: hypothetical protein ABII64_04410 [Elusimicrobiota bacterium]
MRTQFIVKPKIQFKYLLITIFAVIFTAMAVYFVLWSSIVNSAGLEQFTAGEWKALAHAYQTSFVWVIIILVLGFGIESIILFHRLIGPVYKIEGILKMLAQGDLSLKFKLRKHDELQDLAAGVQNVISNFRGAVSEDKKKLEQAIALIDQGNISEAKDKLSTVNQFFKID